MEYKSLPSVKEEKQLALSMYDIMLKNSLIGYEAANHYYFNCGKDSKL